jgi:hypothetical protein
MSSKDKIPQVFATPGGVVQKVPASGLRGRIARGLLTDIPEVGEIRLVSVQQVDDR